MRIQDNNIYRQSIEGILKYAEGIDGGVLVTGASGLIGSAIVDVLVEANKRHIVNVRVFAMGRNPQKLQKRFSSEDVEFVVQDICNPITIPNIKYIIHTASNADPVSYAKFPVETTLTNVIGAKNVLEYCKTNKARALLTSTFEVYGKLDQDVYSEDDYGLIDYNQIRSCYPESKRVAELLFRTYHDEYDVDCVIARLASIYGPTMSNNDSKAHAEFIRNAVNKENIVLKSEGKQKRTYCYLIDAVSGIFTILLRGIPGESYNVANSDSIASIVEVARVTSDIAGTNVVFRDSSELERKGYSKSQNCILDTQKLISLGWEGKYNLLNGLDETINILKQINQSRL